MTMSTNAKSWTMGLATAAMATALLAGAATADAQYVEHWRIEAGDAAPYLSGGLARGLDYNPVTDTVLVAHRSGGNIVIRVNADTGAVMAPALNTTGIAGGLLTLTKLVVVDLGGDAYSIYACAATSDINASVADSQVLRVYRWHSDGTAGVVTENTLGAPTRIYFNRTVSNPPVDPATGPPFPASVGIRRLGDSLKASNSGTTTTLFFGATGAAPTDAIYTLTVDETTGDVTAANIITAAGHLGTTSYGAAPDSLGNFYYFSNGTQMARYYSGAGALLDTFALSVVPQSSVQPRAMEYNGRRFVGFLPGQDSPLYSNIRIVEVTSGVASATILTDATKITVPVANGNGAGEVTLDTSRNRFIGLATDNMIVSFSFLEDPLLVELESLSASVNEPSGTVTVSWETASEIDNVGFNVYRANSNSVTGAKVNALLIPSSGDGASYSLVDNLALAPGESRGYILEDIDANGTATTHGPVTATRGGSNSAISEWPMF